MLVAGVPEQQTAVVEVLHQGRVGVLEELPADERHRVGEVCRRAMGLTTGRP